VQSCLGITFPADYVEYRGRYTHLLVDRFLTVTGPAPGDELAYVNGTVEHLQLVREMAADDMTEGYLPHPEVDGLFPWGESSEGDMFFWRVSGSDPNQWPSVVFTRNGD
jgi:hypothetical protein